MITKEECHKPSRNCPGISHYLESGHPEIKSQYKTCQWK